ncbi:MAG: hypothetical protein CSA49_02030 [Gammaproteobacteria bacterium]|nr:MAG: hypothetical protein CSA49_02030 [Gammaproteobacteria bacterium]
MKHNAPQDSQFIPAKRLSTNKSNEALKQISAKAVLSADMHRAASLDGESPCITRLIQQHHNLAAAVETEIILRSIFNH